MDLEERMELVMKPPTEEVITQEELRNLLETKEHPVAYNGLEPSGLVHLGTGLICGYKMKDFVEAGVRFKVYLATWHAWINNKLEGDMNRIRAAARHLINCWEALGMPVESLEFVWPDVEYDDIAYWEKFVRVAKMLSLSRARRTLEVMGREELEAKTVADLLYTPMQVADIFHFGVDICQLGMDQRKANIVAREVGPSMGLWKPVCVHHHILQGLAQPEKWPLPEDPLERKKAISGVKMSKSKPKTAIFIYDSPKSIREKIRRAFAPPKYVEYNPILDITKYIAFREGDEFTVERSKEHGGSITYPSYEELERDYIAGALHPADLKAAVSEFLVDRLEGVRRYFTSNTEARKVLEELATGVVELDLGQEP
jgi:tyrosyl-tRNA synthetase